VSDPLYLRARQAVRASRLAGAAGVDAETRTPLDVAAYLACQAAGVSIAEIRVKLWEQERRWLALELAASFIHPETDEIPLP
jgi:hypothetical protein